MHFIRDTKDVGMSHARTNASPASFANSIHPKFHQALVVLLEAFDYSHELGDDRWDFAVLIRDLHLLGLNESDLRWLVRIGYVQHAREVAPQGSLRRRFQSIDSLTFFRRTCFVLTDVGIEHARHLSRTNLVLTARISDTCDGEKQDRVASSSAAYRVEKSFDTVHWDPVQRQLNVLGVVVKRYKWQAPNQEMVLNAFQEEGWPGRIDDPLPRHPDQDSKRRLSDTIKCLNRHQIPALIHFHGDGTGEGVTWQLHDSNRSTLSALGK